MLIQPKGPPRSVSLIVAGIRCLTEKGAKYMTLSLAAISDSFQLRSFLESDAVALFTNPSWIFLSNISLFSS